MKTQMKIIIATAIIFMLTTQVRSQESRISYEDLISGRFYNVIIHSGWETEGILIAMDSASISIRENYKIYRIMKKDIDKIEDEWSNSLYGMYPDTNAVSFRKPLYQVSAGAGVCFPTKYLKDDYTTGLNFQLNLTRIINTSYAIRGDLQYSQSKGRINLDFYNAGDFEQYYKEDKGDINRYSVKFDFLLGSFNPASLLSGYAILGGGINFVSVGQTKYSGNSNDYNYLTHEYTLRTFSGSYEGNAYNEIPLEVGAGIGYKITKKVNLYGETQYTFPVIYMSEVGLFLGPAFDAGNVSIRFGAKLDL